MLKQMIDTLQARKPEPSAPRSSSSPWNSLRRAILKLLLGKNYDALRLGRFRQSGEVHQWMYDEMSLGELLRSTGFEGIKRRTAVESYITGWRDLGLDADIGGLVYKPDSLFMEAKKAPGAVN